MAILDAKPSLFDALQKSTGSDSPTLKFYIDAIDKVTRLKQTIKEAISKTITRDIKNAQGKSFNLEKIDQKNTPLEVYFNEMINRVFFASAGTQDTNTSDNLFRNIRSKDIKESSDKNSTTADRPEKIDLLKSILQTTPYFRNNYTAADTQNENNSQSIARSPSSVFFNSTTNPVTNNLQNSDNRTINNYTVNPIFVHIVHTQGDSNSLISDPGGRGGGILPLGGFGGRGSGSIPPPTTTTRPPTRPGAPASGPGTLIRKAGRMIPVLGTAIAAGSEGYEGYTQYQDEAASIEEQLKLGQLTSQQAVKAKNEAMGGAIGGSGARLTTGLAGAAAGAALGTFLIPIPVVGTVLGGIAGYAAGNLLGEATGLHSVAESAGRSAGGYLTPEEAPTSISPRKFDDRYLHGQPENNILQTPSTDLPRTNNNILLTPEQDVPTLETASTNSTNENTTILNRILANTDRTNSVLDNLAQSIMTMSNQLLAGSSTEPSFNLPEQPKQPASAASDALRAEQAQPVISSLRGTKFGKYMMA
jgi:hypothetical protein